MRNLAKDLLNIVLLHCPSDKGQSAYDTLQELPVERHELINIINSCLDDLKEVYEN